MSVTRSGMRAAAVVFALAVLACTRPAPDAPPAADVPAEPPGPPPFADATAAAGIDFTHRNGEEAGHFAILETLGGGVALVDYDRDGLLDVFLPGGGHFEGQKVLGRSCRLYRNLGGFRFEDSTARAGLDAVDFPYSHGAAAFDADRDGWPDLLVTGYSRLVLLRNEPGERGGRRFADATARAGLGDELWSTSAGCGDLDGDGWPEVYVAHYCDWGFGANHPTDCGQPGRGRDVCMPRRFSPLPHTLYRNNRDGTFTDVSAAAGLRRDGKGLGVLVADLNNDARPDVYVANDTDDNFLYLNAGRPGELALREDGRPAAAARDDRGNANGSMGIAAADFDRSGLASVVVTNFEGELPALYRNRSAGPRAKFAYDTGGSGLATVGTGSVSWGAGFGDFDRDGWEDLLIVSGHVLRSPVRGGRGQRPTLAWNRGGRLVPAASAGWPYLGGPHDARGAALGDLDNDGRLDAVVSHVNEPVAVLRNVTPADGRHWVGVRLVGKDHADVVGARVVLESAGGRQTRFAKGGGSYASTGDPRLHFGLGSDAAIDKLTVYWPSGAVQEVAGVTPGAYWTLTEGEARGVSK